MYNWEITRVEATKLEVMLESVKEGWEVFAILPATAVNELDGPVTGSYFLIVTRREVNL
ncbi:MAG TPA: hypothetical protein VJV05_04900 [Pyrinomonadaceae bacterium]|nr:hypothetical protein [Pyrinomonadaceae bacterium]